MNITANYAQGEYLLNLTITGSGTVTRDNPGPYHYGDTVQLTAVPPATTPDPIISTI
jgi:hypothetical protein